ncbi:MAG: NAD-dependent epimerase/dehydratase family protein [Anaerolineae bacterium]
MKRFLITGGAGFLGSALATKLAQAGHEVRVIDDLTTGDQNVLPPDIHFTRGDVQDVSRLWSLLQDVDCVYHLAARVSVAESILYPGDYNRVNTGGAVSLMEAMRDAGVSRVVLASSGAVYGTQKNQPVRESADLDPDSPYAVSKLAAETYIHTIGRLWGIETVALRIFNAYGPGQHLPVSHAPVVPRFFRQAITGGSVVLYGSGNQVRDFVYVSDVVDALIMAAETADINRSVINIGSGHGTSIAELANTMEGVIGRSINRIVNEDRQGGVPTLIGDISLAAEQLGYSPKVSLTQGLTLMTQIDDRFKL